MLEIILLIVGTIGCIAIGGAIWHQDAPQQQQDPVREMQDDNLDGSLVEPVEPAVAPVEPAVAPVEPAVAPVEPAVAPVEPAVAPVEPAVAPAEPWWGFIKRPFQWLYTYFFGAPASEESTSQLIESTSQPIESTSQPTASTSQPIESTSQPTASTSQPIESTSQPTASTSQPTASTSQPTASTSQPIESTSQPTASTSQPIESTSQPTASTSQLMERLQHIRASMAKLNADKAASEELLRKKLSDCDDFLVATDEALTFVCNASCAIGRRLDILRPLVRFSPATPEITISEKEMEFSYCLERQALLEKAQMAIIEQYRSLEEKRLGITKDWASVVCKHQVSMAPLERSERRILKKIKGAGDLEAEVEIKVVKKVDNPFTSSPKWRRDVGPDYLDLCSDSWLERVKLLEFKAYTPAEHMIVLVDSAPNLSPETKARVCAELRGSNITFDDLG